MSIIWYMLIPAIVFLLIVAPLWIVLHYLTQWKRLKAAQLQEGQVVVDRQAMRQLQQTAEGLEQRLVSLEKILDQDSPGWRNQ